ncbi:MAG: type II toxin-antitoxin system RelE/ParE family toxin [Algoriphagus aquaeductus]|uniref:type II toxin-antitoxin system RelE/ParE family toxin n=1 Tax=Algoriphagus aquaeductus TaxID=475299 RepID=UPI00391A21D1
MTITSKGKGKSGGSRVIYFVKVSQNTVFLISIYYKSEKENISDTEIAELLQSIPS